MKQLIDLIAIAVILGCFGFVLYRVYKETKIQYQKEYNDYRYSDDPK